jgi:hypothetical protein
MLIHEIKINMGSSNSIKRASLYNILFNKKDR